MMKILMLVIMMASGIAMPLWMAYWRKRGERGYRLWLTMLLPSALMLSAVAMRLPVNTLLDHNPVFLYVVAISLTASMAAFTGGLLYLSVPFLWKNIASPVFTGVLTGGIDNHDTEETSPPGGGFTNGGEFTHGGDFVNGGPYTHGGPYG